LLSDSINGVGRHGKLWWIATLSGIVLVFGWVLESLGKVVGIVAPWWAWSLLGMAAFAMWGMVLQEIRIDSQFADLAERIRSPVGDLGNRIARVEETLDKIRAWQESEQGRYQEGERERAWVARHKTELDSLSPDLHSEDSEKATKAISRVMELRRELLPKKT
jgi:hypothetical protein